MKWDALPERIPSHFGPLGEPDTWGGKDTIWNTQIFGIVMFGLLWAMKYTPNLWHLSLHVTNENRKDIYMIAYDAFAQLQVLFAIFVGISTYSIVTLQRMYDWAIIGVFLISLLIIMIHLIRLRKYKKRRTRYE